MTMVKTKRAAALPATELSVCDKTALAIATCRALFYPLSSTFRRFDDVMMADAIEQLAADCPMFAGRVRKLEPALRWSVSSLAIVNSNAGIEFDVVNRPDTQIGELMTPAAWTMKSTSITSPKVPSYFPSMDTGQRMFKGKEPVCKVRLTHLQDGDILAVTMSHMLTDGMHWPAFMTHLAARYKELATGGAWTAPPEKLIAVDGNKGLLTYAKLRERLVADGAVDAGWTPEPIEVRAALMDHVRAWTLLFKNGFQKNNFNIVGVPNARLKALKAEVMAQVGRGIESGAFPAGTYVSTGDVGQALSMMMVKGAAKKRVMPVSPKQNIVLAQIPGMPKEGPEKYFGNSVHLVKVSFDRDEVKAELESESESGQAAEASLVVLTRLAVRIRERTLEFREHPEQALQSVFETEEIGKEPVLKALGFLAGRRYPLVNCTTNYIGTLEEDSELSFGPDGVLLNSACQWLVTPLARDMVVVRPHVPDDSMLFMMALTPKQSTRLRELAVMRELVPDATFY